MARLTIDLPEKFIYKTDIAVRASDINYGGHLGNDSVLTLFQEARILFYRHLGFKSELHIDGSVGQLLSDAAVVYKSESFLGDELIIEIAVVDFNKYGFDLLYKMSNKATGKEVARGKTGIVCFDYDKRKVASVPDLLKKKLIA
jgi:acyl-CoA thioester hydrolase